MSRSGGFESVKWFGPGKHVRPPGETHDQRHLGEQLIGYSALRCLAPLYRLNRA